MPSLDDVLNKLNKLWDYLDDMPVDKSPDEMEDLISTARHQVALIIDVVEVIKIELNEVESKIQNINEDV